MTEVSKCPQITNRIKLPMANLISFNHQVPDLQRLRSVTDGMKGPSNTVSEKNLYLKFSKWEFSGGVMA